MQIFITVDYLLERIDLVLFLRRLFVEIITFLNKSISRSNLAKTLFISLPFLYSLFFSLHHMPANETSSFTYFFFFYRCRDHRMHSVPHIIHVIG